MCRRAKPSNGLFPFLKSSVSNKRFARQKIHTRVILCSFLREDERRIWEVGVISARELRKSRYDGSYTASQRNRLLHSKSSVRGLLWSMLRKKLEDSECFISSCTVLDALIVLSELADVFQPPADITNQVYILAFGERNNCIELFIYLL